MKENELKFTLNGAYVYYSFYASDGRASGSTGVKLKEGEDIKSLDKARSNKLKQLSAIIDKYVGGCSLADVPTKKDEVDNLLKEKIQNRPARSKVTIPDLLAKYIEQAEQGKVFNHKGEVHKPNTIKLYHCLLSRVKKDVAMSKKPVEALTEKDFATFRETLTQATKGKKGLKLSKNTVTTYNNLLASFLSATLKLGWHKNTITKTGDLYVSGEVVDYPIYYSIEELTKLYNHKFGKDKERLRDVFVFGCFTCLRHSDYYETDYRNAYNGRELVIKLQKKSNQVTLPLHPIALEILNKYGFVLPKIIMKVFNERIKDVCEEAGFSDKMLFSRTQGGVLVKEYRFKYQLTTSHTMRRSFATNALKSGLKEWVVMAIGGWRSEAAFKKYKRMSEEDATNDALASEFYKLDLKKPIG